MMRNAPLSLFLPLSLLALACSPAGGGDPTTSGEEETTDDSTTTDDTAGESEETTSEGDTGDETDDATSDTDETGDTGGGLCASEAECDPTNEGAECESGYCHAFISVPSDPDAECQPAEPFGTLRLTGTLRDWQTGEVLPNQDLRFAGALPAAQDAINVVPIATATTDADGRFDTTTDQANEQAVGIVSMSGSAPYYLTGTGLVEPMLGSSIYPAGARNHDVWLFQETTLTEWSALLMDDAEIAPFMPLGVNGGVIGRVWDGCGDGVAGVQVVSQNGEFTVSRIRYLNEAGDGFTTEGTASNGLFVIVNPAVPEKFDAVVDGEVVSPVEGTVGTAFSAIFTVTIKVDL